jgi:hypothetical protein
MPNERISMSTLKQLIGVQSSNFSGRALSRALGLFVGAVSKYLSALPPSPAGPDFRRTMPIGSTSSSRHAVQRSAAASRIEDRSLAERKIEPVNASRVLEQQITQIGRWRRCRSDGKWHLLIISQAPARQREKRSRVSRVALRAWLGIRPPRLLVPLGHGRSGTSLRGIPSVMPVSSSTSLSASAGEH